VLFKEKMIMILSQKCWTAMFNFFVKILHDDGSVREK
jgi:hypothetical protein